MSSKLTLNVFFAYCNNFFFSLNNIFANQNPSLTTNVDAKQEPKYYPYSKT